MCWLTSSASVIGLPDCGSRLVPEYVQAIV